MTTKDPQDQVPAAGLAPLQCPLCAAGGSTTLALNLKGRWGLESHPQGSSNRTGDEQPLWRSPPSALSAASQVSQLDSLPLLAAQTDLGVLPVCVL